MAKATLQEAMDEAYASAPSDSIPLSAMEINHPAFTQPLRVVRWPVSGPEPELFRCLHEDDADLDPGAVVEYVGFPFELTLPESSQGTEGTFKFKLAVLNDFDDHLRAAAMGRGVITATFRQYVKGRELEGPAVFWPGITISNPRREGGDVVADGTVLGWMRKAYGGLYLPIDYPALVAGR
jgi:hypothetical protein